MVVLLGFPRLRSFAANVSHGSFPEKGAALFFGTAGRPAGKAASMLA